MGGSDAPLVVIRRSSDERIEGMRQYAPCTHRFAGEGADGNFHQVAEAEGLLQPAVLTQHVQRGVPHLQPRMS